jgi:hypothetical protein
VELRADRAVRRPAVIPAVRHPAVLPAVAEADRHEAEFTEKRVKAEVGVPNGTPIAIRCPSDACRAALNFRGD